MMDDLRRGIAEYLVGIAVRITPVRNDADAIFCMTLAKAALDLSTKPPSP